MFSRQIQLKLTRKANTKQVLACDTMWLSGSIYNQEPHVESPEIGGVETI